MNMNVTRNKFFILMGLSLFVGTKTASAVFLDSMENNSPYSATPTQDSFGLPDSGIYYEYTQPLEDFKKPPEKEHTPAQDKAHTETERGIPMQAEIREPNGDLEGIQTYLPEDSGITATPSAEFLQEVLQRDGLITENCSCVLHKEGSSFAKADIWGRMTATNLDAAGAKAAIADTCGALARAHIQREDRIDWYGVGQCQETQTPLSKEFKASLTNFMETVKQLQEKLEAQHQPKNKFLTRAVSILAAGLSGGFLDRVRGGAYPMPGTQLARLSFTAGMALLGGLDGYLEGDSQTAIDGAVAGLLFGPGSLLGYFGGWDEAKNGKTSKDWKALMMGAAGAVKGFLPAAYLQARGYDATPLWAASAGMGVCYFAFARVDPKGIPTNHFFDGWSARAEACRGFFNGIGLEETLRNQPQVEPAVLAQMRHEIAVAGRIQTFHSNQAPTEKVGEVKIINAAQFQSLKTDWKK